VVLRSEQFASYRRIEVIRARDMPALFSGIAGATESNPALVMGSQAESPVALPRTPGMRVIEATVWPLGRVLHRRRIEVTIASGRHHGYGWIPDLGAPCGQWIRRPKAPQSGNWTSTQNAQIARKRNGKPNSTVIMMALMIDTSYCVYIPEKTGQGVSD
jgi:hypothetical protein